MVIVREIPMMILVALVAVITGIDGVFTAAADSFSRPDGLILLLLLVVFIFYNVKDALRRRSEEEYLVQVEEHIPSRPKESMSIGGIMVLAGLGLLAAGGKLAVTGAVGLASALGVSDALIGLTVIAVGTSLPELATSMIAALKNEPELAVGNVVGSNIINLSLILGLVCTVSPVDVPAGGRLDLVAMLLFSSSCCPSPSRPGGRSPGSRALPCFQDTVRTWWSGHSAQAERVRVTCCCPLPPPRSAGPGSRVWPP